MPVFVRLLAPALLSAVLAVPAAAQPAASPSPAASAVPVVVPAAPAAPASPASYLTFLKKAERQSGLIDIIKKDDDYYFDIAADQFDRPYIVAPVLASGVGADAFAGRIYRSFVLEFKRVGKRVLWIVKNSDFTAPPNSAAANALAISVTDSVINSTPIVAEDEATGRAIVSAGFFLTDFENVGRDLGGRGGPQILFLGLPKPGFSVDVSRSYFERTKALPKNDEILASLAFSGPPGEVGAAPDSRGVRLRMHYSIVDPPADSYTPRLADDRVGYFVTSQMRFDNDALPSPTVRYIDRWNFANGPIVYYLTNEIPAQYKPAIRSALLKWNAAFAKAGIPNAIEVRDQPDDPSWDPDDARYSTVRWITSQESPFAAYGPHISDPRTGEILRVEIVIDGESLRSIKRGYVDRVFPLRRAAATTADGLPQVAQDDYACDDTEQCDSFAEQSAEYAAVGTDLMRAGGATTAQTEKYAEDWLGSVVLHESGHNFGLRHNFVASTLYNYSSLHDRGFTNAHGLVGSVMEYTPVNLSPEGARQGGYFQTELGPYDYWAIQYGYRHFANVRSPQDEAIALHRIAEESTRPEYAYATDQDAGGPGGIDPRVATFDLSSDPLAYDADQFTLIHQLVDKLDRTYPRDDRPYAEERQTFITMLRVYGRASQLAAKYVGGFYTSRDHRGQAGGKQPLAVVPRARARRAFALLADNVFSSKALHVPPALMAQLAGSHYANEQPDFPVEDAVAQMQDSTMFALFTPDVMTRLANAQYYPRGGDAMHLDDLFGWTQAAVWDDLRPGMSSIDPLHRNLQRRYTTLLVAMQLAPTFVVSALGYPADTVPLAGFELRRLSTRLDEALRSPHLDVATRAHLEDIRTRVRHALDAGSVRAS